MYLGIIILNLIGSLNTLLFGRFIGTKGSCIITISCITFTMIFSYISLYEVAFTGSPCYINFFTWFDSEMFSFSWGFLFDTLTCVMLVVVTTVSMFVHIYSVEYMGADPHLQRFMAYLSLFTFFMIILVTSDNFLQMFLGWEGVGLCSYLLINFWYGRLQANKAALKAMIVNRIGDFGLALGVFAIFLIFQSVEYSVVFALAPYFYNDLIIFFNYKFDGLTLICIFLFVGAVGKSAQIGLHTWLPDAMEGPTPVSALIHAATMVTAGVFLIARCSPLFEYAPFALMIVTIMGAMTAFLAATTGLLQNDLKRVIAYSTCSQLGYMVFACGLSSYSVGVFHLANHAFFKALLFLSAGAVIHGMSDEQDMRKMGGLLKILPYTYGMIMIGSLALMGFPFLAGFYSKDIILEVAYGSYSVKGHFAYWLGSISAFFTAFYSIRLIALTFLRETNAYKQAILHAHEAPFLMAFPLAILAFGSIFIGYISKDMMIGAGTDFWGNALFTLPDQLYLLEGEWINTFAKLLPLELSLCGAGLAFFLYNFQYDFLVFIKTKTIGYKFYTFLNRKWFFDKVYNELICQNILNIGYKHTYQNMDRGIIELLGPNGISLNVFNKSYFLHKINTGFIFHYIFIILFGMIILLSFLISWKFFLIYFDLRIIILISLLLIFLIN
ncbi:MAG: NADH-quinone oxidoreductase subunit L [Rickettsiales bacterium]|nr:NADH-quinone oxidoreductase subunit L [Rickettsiales bacterium]